MDGYSQFSSTAFQGPGYYGRRLVSPRNVHAVATGRRHYMFCNAGCGILTAEESLKDLDEVIGDLCLHEPWRLWEFWEALIKATEACRSGKS